jgi:hypothetical protein
MLELISDALERYDMYLFGENGSVRSSLEKRCARLPCYVMRLSDFFVFTVDRQPQ